MFRRAPELRTLAAGLWADAGMPGVCPDNLRTFLRELVIPEGSILPARPDDVLLSRWEPNNLPALGDVTTWADQTGARNFTSTGSGAHPQCVASDVSFTDDDGVQHFKAVEFTDAQRYFQSDLVPYANVYGIVAVVSMPSPPPAAAVAPYIFGDAGNGCFAYTDALGYYTLRTGPEEVTLTPDPVSPLSGYMVLHAFFGPLQTDAKLVRPDPSQTDSQHQTASVNASAYLGPVFAGTLRGGMQMHAGYAYSGTPADGARVIRYALSRFAE